MTNESIRMTTDPTEAFEEFDTAAARKAFSERLDAFIAADDTKSMDVLVHLINDAIDVLTNPAGAGVFFVDKGGSGSMDVHIMGDISVALQMVQAAPDGFARIFQAPDDAVLQ